MMYTEHLVKWAEPPSTSISSSPPTPAGVSSQGHGGWCQGHLITIYFPLEWVKAIYKEKADRWAILGT